ncbi:DUF4214 domain-containing protein [Serratia liquefaciens]|jgi:hypothetical protein|uniref:DUF4214 domain-containing protein n=1 Tax=Serratia liquefaciens TaxID=614 RepID=A0ABX7D103_SERLI|nr:DUF4214 domain-containing protein [Serratia liquefaciens]QQU53961.1 DUF4214 domain-containing protein [Serratia liquefaciens]
MAQIQYEKQIASIYYTLIQKSPTEKTLKKLSDSLEKNGPIVLEKLISDLMKTPEAKALYGNYHNNFQVMYAFFESVHGRKMGEIEFKLWSNDSSLDLNHNLFRIVNELVTNTAPWPQLNDNWSITDDYEYNYPEQRITDREHFLDNGNLILYPGTSNISPSGEASFNIQGIFHVLGAGITRDVTEFWAPLINNGEKTLLQATEEFINSRQYLSKVTDKSFINRVFENSFERLANDTELSFYLNLLSTGSSRAEITIIIMNALRESSNEQDLIAQAHLASASYVYKPGELPKLEYQEYIAVLYLAGAGRNLNSEGLFGWTQKLASGKSYEQMVEILINTSEFNRTSTHLDIESYTKKIYNFVYGHDASNATIEYLVSLREKNKIISTITKDLLELKVTSEDEFNDKFQFAHRIAESLNYKKQATLTNKEIGSPESTVNSGLSHNISLAESTQLENVTLNLTTNNAVDLSLAANIKELIINGNQEAKIKLAEYKNTNFSTINIEGHILELETGNTNTLIILNELYEILKSPTHFYFGSGNDFLGWKGNNTNDLGNKINASFTADGGDGFNMLSANFINLWSEVTIVKGLNGTPDTQTVKYTSNLNQFKNFGLIDLYKYNGQVSTLTYTKQIDGTVVRSSSIASNTFDYAFIDDKIGNIHNIGKKGFSFVNVTNQQQSTTPDKISVINVSKEAANIYVGNHSNNPITGDGGDYIFKFKSDVSELNFFTNQSNGEDRLNKPAGLAGPKEFVRAGEFSLLGDNLKTVNINTNGQSNDNNVISLDLTSSIVNKIVISGEHKLGLVTTVINYGGSTNLLVDATNSSGVDISIGSGINPVMGKKITVLGGWESNKFSLSESARNDNYSEAKFIGGDGDDYFDINNIVTAIGGKGVDFYNIMSYSKNTSTIFDFNAAEDIIGLKNDNIYISGKKSGEKIPFTDKVSGGNKLDDYGYIEYLSNPSLPLIFNGKVGVVSTLDSLLNKDTYIVADLNNNKIFDSNDALIKINGQPDTAELAGQLYY